MAIFRPMHPRSSLRRLKTAFSPFSHSPSPASASSRLPLSSAGTTASSNCSGFSFDSDSSSLESLARPGSNYRRIRAVRSALELQQEEERVGFAHELVAMVEPRPCLGPSLGGIEEILEGRI